jgi:polyvinyl alcohol dehydrogenase (cytochrome)
MRRALSTTLKVVSGLFLLVLAVVVFATLRPTARPKLLQTSPEMPAQAFCSTKDSVFDKPFAGSYWNGWGVDLNNRRSQPGNMAGLPADQVGRLKLKWAFGVPAVTDVLAQPTVAGGRLFFGTITGRVYSIDAGSACIYWEFDAGAPVHTAISIGPADGRWVAYFGDSRAKGAHVYAVDAVTGRLIWKTTVDDSRFSGISGSPVLASGKLYVPVTSDEDAQAVNSAYQCCLFRGSLVALDAVTGKTVWKSYTIAEPARPFRKNSRGVWQWGPSGAGIWSAPTVDMTKRAIYVATGDSHSDPAATTSDAILAFDMDTGAMLWSRQTTAGDVWNAACALGDPENCPEAHGSDLDFGAPPILIDLPGGKQALIASQKSGVVYALDPDRQGIIVWHTRVGKGIATEGIVSGPAVDEQNVYVARSDFSDAFSGKPDSQQPWRRWINSEFTWLWSRAKIRALSSDDGGGMFALRLDSGARVWYTPPQCDGKERCRPAQRGAVTRIPGIVFSGSVDGHLRAYSTDDGRVIWTADTARPYVTVNGVKAAGGSLGGPGPVVVGGVLYVNSGDVAARGLAGNVLLAFSIDGK